MSTHERYLAQATQWNTSGRPATALPGGYSLIALRSWISSEGAKAEGVEAVLQDYVSAALAGQSKDWLDAYFDDRETCRLCGESYRFENIALCTVCRSTVCHRCIYANGRAPNGNPSCSCGAGELVG